MTATPNNNHAKAYILTVLKKLKECKSGNTPQELSFNPSEKEVIEYYLKDLAFQPVKEHASIQECLESFSERLQLLVDGNPEQWDRFENLFRLHTRNLSPEDVILKNELQEHFQKS